MATQNPTPKHPPFMHDPVDRAAALIVIQKYPITDSGSNCTH